MEEEHTKFTMQKVSQILGTSYMTIRRWYKWYESSEYEKPEGLKLPEPTVDSRNIKYFSWSDIMILKQFKEDLKGKYRGCMSEFNAHYQWGKRGKKRG